MFLSYTEIWILWSNSIRLQSVTADSDTKLTDVDAHSSIQVAPSQPLNMETVVRLPSSTKLTQAPNHNATIKLDNKLMSETCPSCNRHDTNPHFQTVPYKTIIQHFEFTMDMLEEHDDSHPSKAWPPEEKFVEAAGNVGFGALPSQLVNDRQDNHTQGFTEETHTIPPAIRQIHPKLRAKGFAMYRNDPLFLLKNCSVCEDCFLAYSALATNNFCDMKRPVALPHEEKEVRYDFPPELDDKKKKKTKPTHHNADEGKENATGDSNIFSDFGSEVPQLPPAILEPPPHSQ